MIDKCHKGSDLFFQIKAFLRNCPFRPPLFLLCRLRPPSPSVCTGASFCTRTAPFPPSVCTGASFCTRTALFSPSVCTTALPCTREGRSENIAKNLKDSFYNRIMHTSYANAFTTTIIIGSRSTSFCQSPGVHSGTRIQAGYTVARCSLSYCRSHRRSGYGRKSNNRHRCSR